MKKFRFAAKLTAAVFAAVALSASVLAAEITDIGGHWSKKFVEYGVENGYINGYPDSTFKPDKAVTRAEFSKMVNSALGITKKAQISFFDIEQNQWYYPEIQKAAYAGYVSGYDNGAFLADNLITRQEAAVILSRIATRPETVKTVDSMKDASSIAAWAKDAFDFAYSKGYFTGNEAGQLTPLASLTRGQAAKILYLLRTEENIHNGDYTVIPGQAVCSETIFTDNITFSSSADAPSIAFDGCRVFGEVVVSTKNKATVTADESKFNVLRIGNEASVSLENGSVATYVSVEAPAVLDGTGYTNVFVDGDKVASGITEIYADSAKVTVSSDAVLKADKLSSLVINDTASVMIQSGSIDSMELTSNAAGSVVTLASGVEIKNLTVNAAASFMGSGKIENATTKVSGVTFATKPAKLNGAAQTGGSEDSGNTTQPGTGSFVPSSVSPARGTSGVSVKSEIVLNFNDSLCDANGNIVTANYVRNYIQVRRNSETGLNVSFDAKLTSTRRIVLTMDSYFAYDTDYYIVIPEGVFYDGNGNKNSRFVSYFVTEEQEQIAVTFNPVAGTENIDPDSNLTISFSNAVRRSDGTSLNTNYLSSTAVELREGSAYGQKVDITATLTSNSRVITVNPDEALKPYTRYYLTVVSGALEYPDGTHLPGYQTYFTTADKLGVTVSPVSGSVNVAADTEITLEFNSEIYRPSGSNVTASYLAEQAIELRQYSTGGVKVDITAVLSSDRKTVTIIPSQLLNGTRYYLTILGGKIANKNGTELPATAVYFTTASEMVPAITPANNDMDVSPSAEIKIQFTDELYDNTKNRITADYVEQKVVVLRKNSASGTVVPYEAQISSDYKTITIVPDTPLSANTTYYLYVTNYTLFNANNRGNVAAASLFKTSFSDAPDFLPYNGEEDVAIDSNIDITFDSKMYASGGSELTAAYVTQKVVELYKDSYDGQSLAFTTSLSADKQTFTINPTYNFEGETTYVVVIRKGSLEDSDGNENELYTSSFKTAETVSTVYTVTPDTRAAAVSLSTPVTVTFESPVYRTNGTIVSGAYIVNNDIIEIRRNSTSGEEVECEVTVSEDNKVITLTPKTKLLPNSTYYVRINSGKLVYSSGASVIAKVTYFTTNDGNPVVSKFELVEAGASHVTMAVTSNTDGVAYVNVYDSNGKKYEAPATDVKGNEAINISVSGLASNTSYTASVYIKDSSGNTSSAKAVNVTTKEAFDMKMGEIGETSAVVVASSFCEGTLDIEYKNLKTGEKVSRVSGLVLKAGAQREFTLSGLDTNTNYEVYASFTDNFNVTKSVAKRFTTLEPKEEVLTLTAISLTDSNGDTYKLDIKNGVAEVIIEKATSINLVAESSVKNSEVTYNAGTAVAAGSLSQTIAVTPGETAEIAVVLTSKDTGNTVNCTVKVTVNA